MIITIYQLYNDIDNLTYIGSTSQKPSIRYAKHKSRSRTYKNKLYKHCLFIGWHNIKLKIICQIKLDNWIQAKKLEQTYQDILKPELNSIRAIK